MRARPGRTPYTGGVFGISGSEFLVIVLVAVIVVGPQRLPEYTRKLTQMVRQLRVFLDNARSQIAEEVGPEMADLDLSSLDPRQYDPRKIVRDALGRISTPSARTSPTPSGPSARPRRRSPTTPPRPSTTSSRRTGPSR